MVINLNVIIGAIAYCEIGTLIPKSGGIYQFKLAV